MWSALHVEVLAYGHTSRESVDKLGSNLRQMIEKIGISKGPLQTEEVRPRKRKEIPEGVPFTYEHGNPIHTESCMGVFLKTGSGASRDDLLLRISEQVIGGPVYDTLRTKEQLEYCVAAYRYGSESGDSEGLRVVVEGNYNVQYVEERIEVFLRAFQKKIRGMSDEKFSECKNAALEAIRNEAPWKASHFWDLIRSGRFRSESKSEKGV
ncbi:hypothetical protein QR680_004947 [Steinernema hermaphroditum]|uniref:Coenzyme PQQ synthesis protein F-like C-terminal lobe domain-containing protein n=1 Tax=Steinernema hermaphroditum TaxID=289476 RepID=A0AA39LUU4_9BILA|nr:hypothetical protein QR680_004947 [Steinernema hermaphroditum]